MLFYIYDFKLREDNMYKNILYALVLSLFLTFSVFADNANISLQEVTLDKNAPIQQTTNYKEVIPNELVAKPEKYLNKNIKFKAHFDKFSSLGLDYPVVNRSSKDYISFLIKRDEIKNYNIPLSELKLIVKRSYAEKELLKLENKDEIEVYGKVFSKALGDPWVDVEKIIILTPKKSDNADNNKETTKQTTESEGK